MTGQEEQKIRVAGYGRVSTQAQAEEGTSAEEQKTIIQEYCKKENLDLVNFYEDLGLSGKSLQTRPGIQRLIEDAKQGKFQKVLFTKLDRLGRTLRDLLNVWNLLQEEYDLDLVCIKEPAVNTEGKFGKVMLAIVGAFAEFEREIIRERTKGGRDIKWRRQESKIGQYPLGYRWDKENKKIVIDDEKGAPIYHNIVSMYLDQHLSAMDIASQFTREAVPTPSTLRGDKRRKVRRWNHTTILKILKNPAYTGKAIHNKIEYERKTGRAGQEYMMPGKELKAEEEWKEIIFPPLIDGDRWNAIQQRIKQQKLNIKKNFRGYEDHFLLANVLYCGECGSKMGRSIRKRNGQFKLTYYCNWSECRLKESEEYDRKKCILKQVDADKLDEEVYFEISRFLADPRSFAKQWLKNLDIEELENRLMQLEEQEKGQNKKLEKAYQLYTNSVGPEKEIYTKERKKDEQIYRSIVENLERTRREYSLAKNKKDMFDEFQNTLKSTDGIGEMTVRFKTQGQLVDFLFSLPPKEKKRIIEAVICPETGGRCEVRYLTASDLLDEIELREMDRKERVEPLTDRDPIFELEFNADLGKIRSLIVGLKKDRLLIKFYTGRTASG